jgi:hypothetical protein
MNDQSIDLGRRARHGTGVMSVGEGPGAGCRVRCGLGGFLCVGATG